MKQKKFPIIIIKTKTQNSKLKMPRNCRSNKATPADYKVNKLIIAEVERLGNLLIKLVEEEKAKREHEFRMADLLILMLTMSNEEEGNKKKEFAVKQKKAFEEYYEASKKWLIYKMLLWKNLLNKELHKFYNKRQYKKFNMAWLRTCKNYFGDEEAKKYKARNKWEAKMFEVLCRRNAKTHYQLENRKNCILHYWKKMN